MFELMDNKYWLGVLSGLFIPLVVSFVRFISKYFTEKRTDRIKLDINLHSTADLKILNDIGSPGISLTVVNRGKRTAKIRKVIICSSIPDNYILTFNTADDAPYTQVDDDFFSQAEIFIELIPLSKATHEHGWVLERDDIADFFFPIGVEYIPFFLEAPSENVKLQVVFFDETKQILIRGFELQQILDHTLESFGSIPINPNKIEYNMGITTPHDSRPLLPPMEDTVIEFKERKLIAETFTEERINKCLEIFRSIWNNWGHSKILSYIVIPSQPIDINKPSLYQDTSFQIGVHEPTDTIKLIDLLVIFSVLGQEAAYHKSIQGNEPTSSTYTTKIQIKTEYSNREATAFLEQIQMSDPIPL